MSRKLPNYLKMYRKRTGLAQRDLAYLTSCRSGAKISRYERRVREPGLRTLLALEMIFGVALKDLFAGIHDDVCHDLFRKAKVLLLKLERHGPGCLIIERTPLLKEMYETRKVNLKKR